MNVILLGSFAGNNAGDMVVLESILNDFNSVVAGNTNHGKNFIFSDFETGQKIRLVIPTLNDKGMLFISQVTELSDNIELYPIPIKKNPTVIVSALHKLLQEFSNADYIFTTAGILFDRKIWNPLYNFVVVYTPFMHWAKYKNPSVKIIGYHVGITSSDKFIGRKLLQKCVRFHDCIYLREKRDDVLLDALGYSGESFFSVDNVFGFHEPKHYHSDSSKKLYINVTLYGVTDEKHFLREVVQFIQNIKKEYEIYFFQTSSRDLAVARKLCQRTGISEEKIYYVGLLGYDRISELLSDCHFFIGMRMHSLIFALKQSCPVIAMGYSIKVDFLMKDIRMEEFLVGIREISAEILLKKTRMLEEKHEVISNRIYEEMERRYQICNEFK